MGLALRDLEFLELLTVVVFQGILLVAAATSLGTPGGEVWGLVPLATVILLGAIIVFWDHIPMVSHSTSLRLRASPSKGR